MTDPKLDRLGPFAEQGNTAAEFFESFFRRDASNRHVIGLGDMVRRFRQTDGQRGIVRQNQQPFRVSIQPARWKNPGQAGGQQIVNRLLATLVTPGCDDTGRLVQGEDQSLGWVKFVGWAESSRPTLW